MNHFIVMKRPGVAAVLALLLGLALLNAPASGQGSDNDVRRQNQELTTRVQDLTTELEAARRQIERLEEQIAQLRQQLEHARRGPATRPSTSPPLPDRVTVDESVPSASPRALFNAVKESHDKAIENMDLGRPGDGKRRAYIKRLESWQAAVNREFRGPIIWHVRVDDARSTDIDRDRRTEPVITLVAVDPQTDARLGEPFDVKLSRALADRLARYDARSELDVLVLRGIIIPAVQVNEDRSERGSFNNPPFIGPFAEFSYSIEAKSLMPVYEDAKEQPATQPAK